MATGKSQKQTSGGSALGFEATLWATADKLRGNLDAAEYKHVVLGLIFLKYISDAFEEKHAELQKEKGADPEDRDEYTAENIFWVPPEARWSYLQGRAKDPVIGKLLDNAMIAIERDNPSLKGVLPKEYARPHLEKQSLGGVIDLVSTIGLGDKESRSKDIIGRVYEYFLSEFASAEGKKGGQFYTPRCVVQLLVEMLAPYKGRVFDPCCGSGGMFVQSVEFVKAHANGNGNLPAKALAQAGATKAKGDISIFGQESNPTTWRLARMNLAIRSIEGNLGLEPADSFHRDLHKDLKADYILANPPFNMSDWGGERLREDPRWKFGVPSAGNANYAWVQHFIHHLAPTGVAGFVLANGSMSSNQSGEGEIRKAIIEADLVDCMVALPGQLFYSTQIPVCLWFLARNKFGGASSTSPKYRDRRGQTLFLDARKLGRMINRVQCDLTPEDIAKIAGTYQNRAIEAAAVIEELIALAKQMREASKRGEKLGLAEDEVAFYDALETNDSAVKALGDENLRFIARELLKTIRENVTIDWTAKESVRAKLRVMVKRILRKHGYPPDKQEKATQTVLQQAELLCAEWEG